MEHGEVANYVALVGCGVSEWPISYLGILLGDNLLKVSFWEPLLSKILRRLAG